MQLLHIRFLLWRVMAVVASAACLSASAAALTAEPSSVANVVTGWAALYGAPLILIVARGVAPGRAARIAGTVVLSGLPAVGFLGFFNLLLARHAALLIGWIALVAVALCYGT